MSNNAPLVSAPAPAVTVPGDPLSMERIENWLVTQVADLLALEPAEINVEEPLSVYGLSSLTGVMLSGDVEDWLRIKVEPTVAWEYPTIRTLAAYLAQEVRAASAGGAMELGR